MFLGRHERFWCCIRFFSRTILCGFVLGFFWINRGRLALAIKHVAGVAAPEA